MAEGGERRPKRGPAPESDAGENDARVDQSAAVGSDGSAKETNTRPKRAKTTTQQEEYTYDDDEVLQETPAKPPPRNPKAAKPDSAKTPETATPEKQNEPAAVPEGTEDEVDLGDERDRRAETGGHIRYEEFLKFLQSQPSYDAVCAMVNEMEDDYLQNSPEEIRDLLHTIMNRSFL